MKCTSKIPTHKCDVHLYSTVEIPMFNSKTATLVRFWVILVPDGYGKKNPIPNSRNQRKHYFYTTLHAANLDLKRHTFSTFDEFIKTMTW